MPAGLSQRALGDAAGLSGAHIARLEQAEVLGASVMVLARVFAVLGMRLVPGRIRRGHRFGMSRMPGC